MKEADKGNVIEFLRKLKDLQSDHDLWLEATKDAPLFLSNDKMDGSVIKVWSERPAGDSGDEEFLAEFEPEILTTEYEGDA